MKEYEVNLLMILNWEELSTLAKAEALQRHTDKLERWAIISSLKFNKDEFWNLHLQQGNPGDTDRLWGERGWRPALERDWGILVDRKSNIQ